MLGYLKTEKNEGSNKERKLDSQEMVLFFGGIMAFFQTLTLEEVWC